MRPLHFYASQSGAQTLDQGEGGGNPFASALIELLGRQTITFERFRRELVDLTKRKSRNFQCPDVPASLGLGRRRFLPTPAVERRVALVMVFSDYSAVSADASLEGAKHDMQRIAEALDKARFTVQTLLDPDRDARTHVLNDFRTRSAAADLALLYTTGHGADVDGLVYLLPGDYPFSRGKAALAKRAVSVSALGAVLQARRANLVFYGGCRNNPF